MPYQGELAEIPAGEGTLTSDNNPGRARYLDLIIAEGIVSEKGVWEKEPGATPYVTSALGDGLQKFTFPGRTQGAGAVLASMRVSGSASLLGQVASLGGTGSSTQNTTGEAPQGSTIVIAVTRVAVAAFSGITDSAGNVYTKLGGVSFGTGAAFVELWVSYSVVRLPAGGTLTFTALSEGNVWVGSAQSFAGPVSTDATQTATAAPLATSLSQATAWTLVDQTELQVVAYGDFDNAANVTPVPTETALGKTAFGVGSILFFSLLPSKGIGVNALLDYWPSPTLQRLLALGEDGVLYKSSGANFVPMAMATTMVDDASLIVLGGQESSTQQSRKAFVFDGGHSKIQVLSCDANSTTNFGNNWNSTTNIPADFTGGVAGGAGVTPPRGGVVHKERLWCWSPITAPHSIYASQIAGATVTGVTGAGSHENFKNAVLGSLEYVQPIGTGIGLRIAAAVSFKGMLFVFKFPRGVYFLDDTDVDATNWRWNLISESVGACDSPYAAVALDDDILFMDATGHLNLISAITQQGITSGDMTAAYNLQQWTNDNVDLSRLNRMCSVFYPAKKLAIFGLSRLSHTKNDLRIFVDFLNADVRARISYSYRDVNRALALRRDNIIGGQQRPILGDDDGVVWKMDQDSKTKTGFPAASVARYQYNRTDFSHEDPGHKNRRKLYDALTICFRPTGTWTLAIDTVLDNRFHETIYFPMGSTAAHLGTFTFGSPLGGAAASTERRRMTGHSFWCSLAGYVAGDGQDFNIISHLVNYRPGGEEQR